MVFLKTFIILTDMSDKNKIPSGWHKIPIGDCIVERKKSPIKVDDATNFGQYPFFTSGDTVLKHITNLVEGENIYLATGGTANVKYYDGKSAYSTDTYVVCGNEKCDTKFLYYALLLLKDYINTNYFQGSGLKHLQKKDFKKHELIIPVSVDEQKRIADALSKMDDAIAQSDSMIEKYELIKTGLMQDLLTFGIDENGNIRSEQTHKFKDSPIGRIPEEWEVVLFGNLTNNGCKMQTGPFGTQLHVYDYADSGVPMINPKDIQNNKIIDDDIIFVKNEKASDLAKYKATTGDLLVARKGDVKKLAVVDASHDGVLCGSDCILIKLPKILPASFFFLYYQTHNFMKEVVIQSVGTTLPTLKPAILRELHVPIVPFDEQNRIHSSINKIESLIDKEKGCKYKLESQRFGTISDLVTGNVRI